MCVNSTITNQKIVIEVTVVGKDRKGIVADITNFNIYLREFFELNYVCLKGRLKTGCSRRGFSRFPPSEVTSRPKKRAVSAPLVTYENATKVTSSSEILICRLDLSR